MVLLSLQIQMKQIFAVKWYWSFVFVFFSTWVRSVPVYDCWLTFSVACFVSCFVNTYHHISHLLEKGRLRCHWGCQLLDLILEIVCQIQAVVWISSTLATCSWPALSLALCWLKGCPRRQAVVCGMFTVICVLTLWIETQAVNVAIIVRNLFM